MNSVDRILAGEILWDGTDFPFDETRGEYRRDICLSDDFRVGDIGGNDYARIWSNCAIGVKATNNNASGVMSVKGVYYIYPTNLDEYPDHQVFEEGETDVPLILHLRSSDGGENAYVQACNPLLVKDAPFGYYQRGYNAILVTPRINRNWRVGVSEQNVKVVGDCLPETTSYKSFTSMYMLGSKGVNSSHITYGNLGHLLHQCGFFANEDRLTYPEAFSEMRAGNCASYALSRDFVLAVCPLTGGIMLGYQGKQVGLINMDNLREVRIFTRFSWLEDSIREVLQ